MDSSNSFKLSISTKKLDDFFNTNQAFYGLTRERISTLLLTQLYIYNKERYYSIFQITDEIKYLEGLVPATRTNKERPFKGDILRGLWKKHFYSDRYLAKNISNYWKSSKGERKLSAYIDNAFKENESEYLEQETINKISYYTVFHPFEHKSSRAGKARWGITGEWIIFAKHNDKNYYLCIGKHNQDESIMTNINNMCKDEFPFLFSSNEKQ